MKAKLTISSLILAFLFASNLSFGHGETQTKSSCSWGWKRKAIARTNNGPGIHYSSQKGCGSSYSAYSTHVCAWQQSHINGSSSTFYGAVTGWSCGRGYPNSDMFYDMMQYQPMPPNDTVERVSVSSSSIDFLPHKIKINNVLGFIEAKDDMKAYYQVRIWVPNHDLQKSIEDTIIDDNEVIWNGKVTIIDNQMILEGGFYNEKFDESMNGNKKRVSFNGKNFNIHLPNSVDVDDVVVVITADGGYNEQKALRKAAESTETAIQNGDIKFDVFPNPTISEFNVNFKSKVDGKITVKLYNITGQLIQNVHDQNGKKDEEITVKVDTKSLNIPKGVYFVFVEDGSQTYIKKIVLE